MPGCTSNTQTPAHELPKDPGRRYLWLKSIKLEKMEHVIGQTKCKMYVCHKHFSKEDYVYSLRRRKLKYNAIPTLYIPRRIDCIAATHNIDCPIETSASILEFCPDVVALQPQSEYTNLDVRHVSYVEEVNVIYIYIMCLFLFHLLLLQRK